MPNPKVREEKTRVVPSWNYWDQKFPASWNDEVAKLMDYNTFHQMYNIWKREAQTAREKSRSQRPEYHMLESINNKSEQQRAKTSTLESSSLGTKPIFVQPISAARPGPMLLLFLTEIWYQLHQILKLVQFIKFLKIYQTLILHQKFLSKAYSMKIRSFP